MTSSALYPLRSTVAEIHLENLRHNVRALRSRAQESGVAPKVMAVVKANAYGHGVVECAEVLLSEGASMLGVAFAAEAQPLRTSLKIPGVTRIAVITPPFAHGADEYCRLNLEFCAASVDTVRAFAAAAERTGQMLYAHLYIDTGMRRDGIEPHHAVEFMQVCSEFTRNITFHGICTHFATADEHDKTYFDVQVTTFKETIRTLRDAGFEFPLVHAANSGAIADSRDTFFTLKRPGIALYGYNPSQELHYPLSLRPVMTLKTRIISTRRIPSGSPVSYGRRYVASHETTIATIPIGYADGLRRGLTNKARCLIHGQFFPIVGTICMDQCMVDVGNEPCAIGDEVMLLGEQVHPYTHTAERITAEEWATALNTIPYEILTGISERVPRVYVE